MARKTTLIRFYLLIVPGDTKKQVQVGSDGEDGVGREKKLSSVLFSLT